MSTPDPIAVLRERARSLRRLAASLDASGAGALWRRAGTDTWEGPLARACLDDLLVIRRRLTEARDDLTVAARRLDAQADAADVAARAVRG